MYQLLYISWKHTQSFSTQHDIIQKNKKEKNKNNINTHDINTPNILVNKELINIIDKSIEMTERQIISLVTCGDVY
jgi:hypothetical protein